MTKQMKHEDLEALRLPELQAKFAEVVGKETKAPNRKFLIRKINEALAAEADAGDATPETATEATETAGAPTGDAETEGGDEQPKEKLSKLDVPTLQARFHDLVGRETKSTNHRYLVHRVREATKGRIPVGQRAGRRGGEKVEAKVLPMRVPTAAIEPLDDVRRKLGLRSRNEMFRAAMAAYLINAGESDLAGHFGATFADNDAE